MEAARIGMSPIFRKFRRVEGETARVTLREALADVAAALATWRADRGVCRRDRRSCHRVTRTFQPDARDRGATRVILTAITRPAHRTDHLARQSR